MRVANDAAEWTGSADKHRARIHGSGRIGLQSQPLALQRFAENQRHAGHERRPADVARAEDFGQKQDDKFRLAAPRRLTANTCGADERTSGRAGLHRMLTQFEN